MVKLPGGRSAELFWLISLFSLWFLCCLLSVVPGWSWVVVHHQCVLWILKSFHAVSPVSLFWSGVLYFQEFSYFLQETETGPGLSIIVPCAVSWDYHAEENGRDFGFQSPLPAVISSKKYPGSWDLKGWPRYRAPLSRLFNSLVLLANPIVLWLGTWSFSLLLLLVPK